MGEAEARQAAEGVKIELVLTAEDIEFARSGRHAIEVTRRPDFEHENDLAANKHPVQVIVVVSDDIEPPE